VATYREAASVIANPETGILNIRATSRQHEKVQEFLDQVLTNAKRQVLIEATVAEVQLNNEYQRGIDWQRLRTNATAVGTPGFGTGNSGLEFSQQSANTPANITTNFFVLGGAIASLNFNFALKLLESFGDVRVLSSPKISVLNNQTAVLKVVDNLVYFTIQAQTQVNVNAPSLTTFTTTLNSVPVGFIMSLVPQISDADSVVLNLRPTISRKIADVADPNPALATAGVTSLIPVIQTREMESVLRVQSGQVAVLGGLMQDASSRVEDTIPGVRDIPFIGQLLENRKDLNQKTELVIFLRPVVIRDASVDGDYSAFRSLLPGSDFLSKPNPARPPRPPGPFD
jgi:general secretion pathway protein D